MENALDNIQKQKTRDENVDSINVNLPKQESYVNEITSKDSTELGITPQPSDIRQTSPQSGKSSTGGKYVSKQWDYRERVTEDYEDDLSDDDFDQDEQRRQAMHAMHFSIDNMQRLSQTPKQMHR